jgi:hypothetical protein
MLILLFHGCGTPGAHLPYKAIYAEDSVQIDQKNVKKFLSEKIFSSNGLGE